jgi:hypothetical protein
MQHLSIEASTMKDKPHMHKFSVPPAPQGFAGTIVCVEVAMFIDDMDHQAVTKTVTITQQNVESCVFVDRRCLFTFDIVTIKDTDGRYHSFEMRAFDQDMGKMCPCCGKTVLAESGSEGPLMQID